MSISIKIQNLYKEYRLGIIGSGTLYRDLQSFWAKINNKPDPNSIINATNNSSNKGRRFLALKGINLEIEKPDFWSDKLKNDVQRRRILQPGHRQLGLEQRRRLQLDVQWCHIFQPGHRRLGHGLR